MTALDREDRDQAVARWRAAADLLARQPDLEPVAARLRAWLAAGATRRAASMLIPPAPRGGDLGRGENLRRAISWIRKFKRELWPGLSNRAAA